jgi:hypothetical protein
LIHLNVVSAQEGIAHATRHKEHPMLDIILICLGVGFFAASVAYAYSCYDETVAPLPIERGKPLPHARFSPARLQPRAPFASRHKTTAL